jgi:hypothetical protein
MRVDRGIDREETAVAAVSESYCGDNVFRVENFPHFVDTALGTVSCKQPLT